MSINQTTSALPRVIAWAAFLIANIALVFVILFTIHYRFEAGYNARLLEDQTAKVEELQGKFELWRVYVETLRSSMVARGIETPPLPTDSTVDRITTKGE